MYNSKWKIFQFSVEEMKLLLSGKFSTFKCIACNGTGVQNWSEDGDDVCPGWSDREDRESGDCDECQGVGQNFKINYE